MPSLRFLGAFLQADRARLYDIIYFCRDRRPRLSEGVYRTRPRGVENRRPLQNKNVGVLLLQNPSTPFHSSLKKSRLTPALFYSLNRVNQFSSISGFV